MMLKIYFNVLWKDKPHIVSWCLYDTLWHIDISACVNWSYHIKSQKFDNIDEAKQALKNFFDEQKKIYNDKMSTPI